MSTQQEMKNDLKNLSIIITRIHKGLMTRQMQELEEKTGQSLAPNAKLQLLLSDPAFHWLRVLSLLIVKIDDSVFSKEPIQEATVTALKSEIKALLIEQSDDAFASEFKKVRTSVPDVLKDLDALRDALAGNPPLLH